MLPIFLAIDTPFYSDAERLLKILGDHVDVKIGLEFFVANGPEACQEIVNVGASKPRRLFLDLKFHDIPVTVAGAVRSAMFLEPDFLTIHTCEGLDLMRAAVEAANATNGKRPDLLGVTYLTSSSDKNEYEFQTRVSQAFGAGLDGIICPPSYVRLVRDMYEHLFLMVPGIRMENSEHHDQKNVGTPRQAMMDGADALVIGREITLSQDPLKTVWEIKESME